MRDVNNVTRDRVQYRPPVAWNGRRGRVLKVTKPAVSCVVLFDDGGEMLFTYRAALDEYRAFPWDAATPGLTYA